MEPVIAWSIRRDHNYIWKVRPDRPWGVITRPAAMFTLTIHSNVGHLLVTTKPSPRHATGTMATAEVVRRTWRTGAVVRPIIQAARDDIAAAAHRELGGDHDEAVKVTSMIGGQ